MLMLLLGVGDGIAFLCKNPVFAKHVSLRCKPRNHISLCGLHGDIGTITDHAFFVGNFLCDIHLDRIATFRYIVKEHTLTIPALTGNFLSLFESFKSLSEIH